MDCLSLKLRALSEQFAEETKNYRRFIHEHPELSGHEHGTAAFVADRLRSYGLEPQMLLDDKAVCVLVEGKDGGSGCVALRADMDALPIQEETGLPFASLHDGVMHACGHDAHTAMLMTVARILQQTRALWRGSVKLFFQPSEEQYPGGAIQLIEAGVLDNPNVSAIIGCHVSPEIACGSIGYKPGPYMASTDELHITLYGKSGHAALPGTFVNPIGIAAEAMVRLEKDFEFFRVFASASEKGTASAYSATPDTDCADFPKAACNFLSKSDCTPSSKSDCTELSAAGSNTLPSVCTFGRMEALGKCNVVPECAKLEGTLRTFDESWRSKAQQRIKEIFEEVAMERKGKADVQIAHGYPVLVNDPTLSAQCARFACDFLGSDKVLHLDYRTTADDFAYFSHRIPAFFYRLGVGIPDLPCNLHSSTFNMNEKVFSFAPALMAGMALEQLLSASR